MPYFIYRHYLIFLELIHYNQGEYYPDVQYGSVGSDKSKNDDTEAQRWNYDYLDQARKLIAFQPIFKFTDLDLMQKSGELNTFVNSELSPAAIKSDNNLIRNKLFSYLRVVKATEHDDSCKDSTCEGCATPLVQGDRYTRYNGVGYHEIMCYNFDGDPDTICDTDIKACPFCYIKNGNQRVKTYRTTVLTTNDSQILTDLSVERVSKNSFFQDDQNDRNATEYRWAEIDMGDWGQSKQGIINQETQSGSIEIDENTLEHSQPGNLNIISEEEEIERLSAVLKPGDIILVNNKLTNGRLADDAEFVVWVGDRSVESMYPQFDNIVGKKGVFIGTENGQTGPCIRTLDDFKLLPNYDNRAQQWTVFRCVKPEMDSRYRNAGYYMAEVTQTLRIDYYIYRREHPEDFE